MIPWEEIDATLSCSVNDVKTPVTLTIELHIDIVKSYGFRRRARYEYSFMEPSIETDMVLIVENKELFVNATTETIPDVSAEDFLELLNVVYPSQKPVTVENVETLLKLGDRYAFECVLVKCENFLITTKADEIDVFTRLEWASKYAMADLQVNNS
ncbi:BTB/POZ domain protein [Teladorsagia circumcincta]|uniref:BTB/POZ domain protein n=1 Tax=Teladorsagia circumcincta TaxID=45464 RepID=A0A2G9TRW9_TELCI|nr:BTB/POZ domain protein [Teladorsagia circumcincta]